MHPGVARISQAFKDGEHLEQLASISEMCDRTVYEAGANGLSAVLHEY